MLHFYLQTRKNCDIPTPCIYTVFLFCFNKSLWLVEYIALTSKYGIVYFLSCNHVELKTITWFLNITIVFYHLKVSKFLNFPCFPVPASPVSASPVSTSLVQRRSKIHSSALRALECIVLGARCNKWSWDKWCRNWWCWN